MPRESYGGVPPGRKAILFAVDKMPAPEITIAPSLQSERLLKTLAPYSTFRIVTHDNPDPDAIAAGWGLQRLLSEHFDRPVEFVAGGASLYREPSGSSR